MTEPIGFDETDDEYVARLEAEIGRLRAIVRVNLMRCEGATHEEIDRILDAPDAVGPARDCPFDACQHPNSGDCKPICTFAPARAARVTDAVGGKASD